VKILLWISLQIGHLNEICELELKLSQNVAILLWISAQIRHLNEICELELGLCQNVAILLWISLQIKALGRDLRARAGAQAVSKCGDFAVHFATN
jgi:hypothetical protein